MERRRRARVVLPEEEQPERPRIVAFGGLLWGIFGMLALLWCMLLEKDLFYVCGLTGCEELGCYMLTDKGRMWAGKRYRLSDH